MITTKKIKLTSKEYFRILITRYVKRRWWLFAWILGLAIIMWLMGDFGEFEYFFTGMAVVYPILLVWQLWRYANSKDNKLFLLERYYEIEKEKINGIIDDDTSSPIKIEHFIKFDFIRNTYLLFIAKNQFIYIPVDSFQSENDLNWFTKEILTQIKK